MNDTNARKSFATIHEEMRGWQGMGDGEWRRRNKTRVEKGGILQGFEARRRYRGITIR